MALYRVAVDAMGGDNAPGAVVEGALMAARVYPDVQLMLFGPAGQLKNLLGAAAQDVAGRIEIVDASDVIDIHEPPMLAVRRKTASSLVMAMMAVKEGRAQAVVSAGPTGAVLAGGVLRVGRLEGIDRPALCPVLPGRKKPFLLVDAGANVDCQPEYLCQFGLMGSVYMQKVLGVARPRVMLANIGAEAEKGNRLSKAAYQLMSAQKEYDFAGNIEAREIPMGEADVVVADGFDGNLILKYTEGLAGALVGMLKDEMLSSTRAKLGALLMKNALRAFKNRMSYEKYGGAPLLGVKGALIKAHGSSDAEAIMNAIRQARAMVEGGVAERIGQGVGALRAASGGQSDIERLKEE